MNTNTLHNKFGLFGSIPILFFKDARVTWKPNCLKVYIAIQSFEGVKDEAYPSQSQIGERANLTVEAVSKAVQDLEDAGWLKVSRTSGGRNRYHCLKYDEVIDEFNVNDDRGKSENSVTTRRLSDHPESLRIEPPGDSPTHHPESLRNIKDHLKDHSEKPILLSKDSSNKASDEALESPEKVKDLQPWVKTLIQEVLPLGEFRNRLFVEGREPAKFYFEIVQKFLVLLMKPDQLIRSFPFDDDWIRDEKIDLDWFSSRLVEPVVRRAVKRLSLMRQHGYEPENKKVLPIYIQDFFYNPQQKKSWFLFCCFHEPVEINRANKDLADLADDDRAMILKHKPDDWSEKDFLLKAVKLLKWYRKVAPDLQVYNYYVTDAVTPWQTRFSDFNSFLGVIDEYSKTWKEWTIGNFGLNNGTWDYFVKWCRDTFKVELDPSPTEVKEAMKAKEREDRRSKEREADRGEPDTEVAERQSKIREELLAELGEV